LLALLALNSICWISFFIHCHQALTSRTWVGPQQQQQPVASNESHLILTFASSNLLVSLLICYSQRKQLKRACQLLGLSRFVALAFGSCCRLADATKASPASSSSVSSTSYYNNHHHHANHNGVQHGDKHHPHHYGTSKSIKISSAPSQQSLFVISRSRPVASGNGGAGGMLAEIAQPTYGQQAAYAGPQQHHQQQQQAGHYPMLSNQHLYQQLAGAGSQQHIYDSTTNLSQVPNGGELLAEQHKQRQLNALHLMVQQNHRQQQQQQHHPFNQQEPMIHYTLGRPFNGSQYHLNQQQPYFQAPGNMTLKPLPSGGAQQQQQQMSLAAHQHHQGARSEPHEPLVCPISGAKTHSASSSGRQQQQQFQQQQQQQQLSVASSSGSSSGEADGPLVALAQTITPNTNKRRHEFSIGAANQSKPAATFGPMHHHHNMSSSSSNNNNYNNNSAQQATERRPSDNSDDNQSFAQPIGHGGGGGGGGNHCAVGGPANGKPIKHANCNQAGQQCSGSGKQAGGGGGSQNYADALKAAMAQEANQQHFRRTNSTAMRQQQQQRSFASSSLAAVGPPMIDAQLDCRPRAAAASSAADSLTANGNNIYDVVECAPANNLGPHFGAGR
jgi:hypothetical protein